MAVTLADVFAAPADLSSIEIPEKWEETRRAIVAAVGGAPVILAGGALRDLATGRTPVDLDFFVECESLDDAERLELSIEDETGMMRSRAVSDWMKSEGLEEYAQEFEGALMGVSEFLDLTLPRVQIVYIRPTGHGESDFVEQLLTRFDFATCCIARHSRGLSWTAGAAESISEECFVLQNARNGRSLLSSIRRLDRWRKGRYSGWGFELAGPIDVEPGARVIHHG